MKTFNFYAMNSSRPDHLPVPLLTAQEWDQLYEFNSRGDEYDFSEHDWKQIPIPIGAIAEDVYRLIPSSPNYEFRLLTERIHFIQCGEKSANTINSYLCTFHTHPTGLEGTEPDLPSSSDIYSFLKWRNQRAITVGVN